MKCVICKTGETEPGHTTVTIERDEATLVFKEVPAEVCSNCGEGYLSEAVTAQLAKLAAEAKAAGVQVDIRQYREAV